MKYSILATFNRDRNRYSKHFWQAKQAEYYHNNYIINTYQIFYLFYYLGNIILSFYILGRGREYLYSHCCVLLMIVLL